jgi:hypothetical protein
MDTQAVRYPEGKQLRRWLRAPPKIIAEKVIAPFGAARTIAKP